jgi:hypothetical protein
MQTGIAIGSCPTACVSVGPQSRFIVLPARAIFRLRGLIQVRPGKDNAQVHIWGQFAR